MMKTFLYTTTILVAVAVLAPAPVHAQGGGNVTVQTPQGISGSEWVCTPVCDSIGTSTQVQNTLENAVENALKDSAKSIEDHLSDEGDNMVEAILKRINQIELDIIDWWETMWNNALKPSLQGMTDQLIGANADQSRQLQSASDATTILENIMETDTRAVEAAQTFTPAPNPCGDATVSGGQGRAASISRGMRAAWENDSLAIGLNKKGSIGATGALAVEHKRYEDYKKYFCNPEANGGRNDCPGSVDPKYMDADTQPTRFINDQLTIDVRDPKMAKTVETLQNNMIGVPTTNPISKSAINSPVGRDTYLDRRSYLARHAAARSITGLTTSWRMPGSQMGKWVEGLRKASGTPIKDISDNPSYREIMYALTVDRFNTGDYATRMIGDASEIEMEKLTLNAFYLMQLRDYYELLERTALVLAVQVAMIAEEQDTPTAIGSTPVKQ